MLYKVKKFILPDGNSESNVDFGCSKALIGFRYYDEFLDSNVEVVEVIIGNNKEIKGTWGESFIQVKELTIDFVD